MNGSISISGRRRRMISAEQAAYEAFIRHYRAYEFDVDIADSVSAFRRRFSRPVIDDWQEVSRALIWRACRELSRVEKTLPGGIARRLIAEKFDGLPLGRGRDGRSLVLHLGQLSLWRWYKKRAHLAGGSADAYTKTFPSHGSALSASKKS